MQLAALALCWKGLEEYTSKVGLYSPFEDLKFKLGHNCIMLAQALKSTIAMSLYSPFEDLKHKLAQNYIILAEVLKSKYQKLTRVLNLKI
jgi:hypothetical protein